MKSHLTVQPCLRGAPFALDHVDRDLHHFGRLFDRQPAKKSKLYDSPLLRIDGLEFRERFVEGRHFGGGLIRYCMSLVQRYVNGARTAFCIQMAASMVDQDSPHHLGSYCKEVGAIVPLNISLIDESKECFVDQRRSLESVSDTLAIHMVMCETVQLAINERSYLFKSCKVSFAPINKKLGYVWSALLHR